MGYVPKTKKGFAKTYKKSGKQSKKTLTEAQIDKKIDRKLDDRIENKKVQAYNIDMFLYAANSGGSFSDSIIPLSPYSSNGATNTALQINQSVGDGGRVGNKITLKKLHFNFVLHPNAYDVSLNPTPQPTIVKLWLMYNRDSPTTMPTPAGDFFDLNNGELAMQSDTKDLLAVPNNSKYRVLATRTYKLGYASFLGQGVSTNQPFSNNNDYKLSHIVKMDILPHVVKNVVYNDNNSTPTTRGLYAMFEVVNADGTTPSAGHRQVLFHYSLDCEFEDA